jgi:peptide/nickel transport system substrate-binding protein/oligopeptide transport system substrate-binding protein
MRSRGALIAGIVLVALVLVLAAVFSACGSSSSSSSSTPTTALTPTPGGTYNYPLDGEPVGIAPNTYQESIGYNIVRQVFEGLFKYQVAKDGVTMDTVPELCTKYTVSPDAKVFTFTIRQGVYFQPPVGTEVTAYDFVKSWNAVADPKNWVTGTPAYILEPIVGTDETGAAKNGLTGVKALDKWTLQVTLKYPFAEFPASLGHPILSVWPVAYAMKEGLKNFDQNPIGTGPYMLSKWVHNQEVDLVKNPHWWDASLTNGPFVDAIHMPEFTDPSTEWLAFQAGQIDFTSVPTGQVYSSEALAKSKGWIAKSWPDLGIYFIGINQKSPVVGGPKNLPLRQALAYSVDRNAVINTVSQGVPLMPNGVVPIGIPGSNLSTLPYPYDPTKAKQIVQSLGKVPPLKLWYNTGANHDKILAPVQAGWQAIGLNVSLTGYEWGTYLTKCSQGTQDELFRLGWLADYPSMDDFLYPLFQSGVSGANTFTFYSNPTVDKLLAQARGTLDQTQRLQIYAQAEKLILADVPIIPLYFYRDYRIMDTRVRGQQHDPMGSEDMNLVWVAQ